jgi:hypothetical protein
MLDMTFKQSMAAVAVTCSRRRWQRWGLLWVAKIFWITSVMQPNWD